MLLNPQTQFSEMTDTLMRGDSYYQNGDMRAFIEGGAWVDYRRLDKVDVTPKLANLVKAAAINQTWRGQRMFYPWRWCLWG